MQKCRKGGRRQRGGEGSLRRVLLFPAGPSGHEEERPASTDGAGQAWDLPLTTVLPPTTLSGWYHCPHFRGRPRLSEGLAVGQVARAWPVVQGSFPH